MIAEVVVVACCGFTCCGRSRSRRFEFSYLSCLRVTLSSRLCFIAPKQDAHGRPTIDAAFKKREFSFPLGCHTGWWLKRVCALLGPSEVSMREKAHTCCHLGTGWPNIARELRYSKANFASCSNKSLSRYFNLNDWRQRVLSACQLEVAKRWQFWE